MTEPQYLPALLEELSKTVQEKGPEAVISLLRNSRSTVGSNEDIQFVILMVCNHMGVDINTLLNEQSSDDGTKYAKGFIVFYLRESFEIEWSIIKEVLKHKNQSYLWKLMNNIKTLKNYLAAQKTYFDYKVILDTTIKNYIDKK